MKRSITSVIRDVQRGSVSIEAAVCITFILLPLMPVVLLFGRYFWYYTVAQKAAHDAGLYMASAPLSEVKGSSAAGMANDIINWETSDLDLATKGTLVPTAICGYKLSQSSSYISWFTCNSSYTPTQVRAGVVATIKDPFLGTITNTLWGLDGIAISAGVTMRYVGH